MRRCLHARQIQALVLHDFYTLHLDDLADNARLILLITNPEAFPWRTERLRKVLRGLNNAMVPVDVMLFSPAVASLFAAELPVESSWEKLKELGEIGR